MKTLNIVNGADEVFNMRAVNALAPFDVAEHLDSDQAIAAYLNDFLEEGDASMLAHVLGTVARARGMTHIAESSGITREALYKALRADSSPRLDTVMRVMKSLGLRLVAEPIPPLVAAKGQPNEVKQR